MPFTDHSPDCQLRSVVIFHCKDIVAWLRKKSARLISELTGAVAKTPANTRTVAVAPIIKDLLEQGAGTHLGPSQTA